MNTPYRRISPQELQDKQEAFARKGCLIDVRNPDEFASIHVRGAQCVPLPRLMEYASSWSPREERILICHSGQRAAEAARQLHEAGFTNLSVVEGGTQACQRAGVPVVRGRHTLPIQRQVLIGTGLVVSAGLVLSLYRPPLILISWLAAVSLILAGITGFCPMAKLLAAAPWNRPSKNQSAEIPQATCALPVHPIQKGGSTR